MWPFKKKKKPEPFVINHRATQWAAPWGEIVWVCKLKRSDMTEYTARNFMGLPITFPSQLAAHEWGLMACIGEKL